MRPARGGSASTPATGGVSPAWVGAEIRDGEFTFQLRLPVEGTGNGTEGGGGAEAVIERMTNDDGMPPSPLRQAHPGSLRAACPFALAAGEPTRIEFENVDDRVALRVGGREVLALEYVSLPSGVDVTDPDTVLAVDEALTALAAEDPGSADVARLRLFAGLSADEAADALGVSRATAFRDWAYARAWLTTALADT